MTLEITMISHACLKIRGKFGGLICDPWMLNEPIFNLTTWKYPLARLTPEEVLEGMDTLFLTHGHEDHFHIPSLDYFPRDFKILLPEYTCHPGLRAQSLERILRKMGFHNIRKILPWQKFSLGENTHITHIPSAVSRAHDWENAGFVLDDGHTRILNMNDNVFDEALAQDIVKNLGVEFDIGFIQSVGVSMYPGCYKMSAEKMREEANNRQFSFKNQSFMVNPLQVKLLVPHAGDFCWLDKRYEDYNWTNRGPATLFEDLFHKHFPDGPTTCGLMHPSDTWTASDGITRHHPPLDWDRYLDDIRSIQKTFEKKTQAIQNWFASSPLDDLENRTWDFLTITQQNLCQDYVCFQACIQIKIEGNRSDFEFYISGTPETGFQISRTPPPLTIDQTLFIPQEMWASILERKAMWGMVQWASKHLQHVPYRLDIGRLYFWLEYYIDLMNRPSQIFLENTAHPHMSESERVMPQKGVFHPLLFPPIEAKVVSYAVSAHSLTG